MDNNTTNQKQDLEQVYKQICLNYFCISDTRLEKLTLSQEVAKDKVYLSAIYNLKTNKVQRIEFAYKIPSFEVSWIAIQKPKEGMGKEVFSCEIMTG